MLRQPTPEEERRLRERWLRVGRALVAALATVGATWAGHSYHGYQPPGTRKREDRG